MRALVFLKCRLWYNAVVSFFNFSFFTLIPWLVCQFTVYSMCVCKCVDVWLHLLIIQAFPHDLSNYILCQQFGFVYTTDFNGLIFSAVLIASKFNVNWANSLGLKIKHFIGLFLQKKKKKKSGIVFCRNYRKNYFCSYYLDVCVVLSKQL